MIRKVSLNEKLNLINELWSPKIAGEINDVYVKLAKLKGEFIWHQHADEDELFLVIKGKLVIHLRESSLELGEGEFAIIPRGVEHKPSALEEVHVLLIEPKTTRNTGDVQNQHTRASEWI